MRDNKKRVCRLVDFIAFGGGCVVCLTVFAVVFSGGRFCCLFSVLLKAADVLI